MSAVIKGAIAFGGVAGVAGVSYGVYQVITPKEKSYSEIFKDTLLTATGTTHETQWKARLASLKKIEKINDLVVEIRGLKDNSENNAWTKLRDWCKKVIDNESKGDKDSEYQNIQNYCTFTIKEKLSKIITKTGTANDNSEWKVGHTALKQIPDDQLDQKLIEAKAKTAGQEANTAVKAWCDEWLEKPYKGKDNQEFKNASKVCATN